MSAFFSFFLFSYIDEYETLILPFFQQEGDGYEDLFREEEYEERLRGILVSFNQLLSEVYVSADPAKVSGLPAGKELKMEISGETDFLKKRGRILNMEVLALKIVRISRLSAVATQVDVVEKALTGYSAYGSNEALSPQNEIEYGMTYTLVAGPEGMIIASYEVKSLEEIREKKQ